MLLREADLGPLLGAVKPHVPVTGRSALFLLKLAVAVAVVALQFALLLLTLQVLLMSIEDPVVLISTALLAIGLAFQLQGSLEKLKCFFVTVFHGSATTHATIGTAVVHGTTATHATIGTLAVCIII